MCLKPRCELESGAHRFSDDRQTASTKSTDDVSFETAYLAVCQAAQTYNVSLCPQ